MKAATALCTASPATGWLEVPESGRAALAERTSLIVVAYNAGDDLRQLLGSIAATEPDVDVIVVDNASSDGAVDRVIREFPAARVVRVAENRGFGAGNNLGAAAAGRDYLVFVNPDALLLAGWLDALVRPLVADAGIGLVTPKVLLKDDPGRINAAGLDVHLSGISMCRGLGSPRAEFAEPVEVAAISGVCFATRREVYERIGGFDEDIFLYMEDVDLSLRVWLAGYRCLYVAEAAAQHSYALEVGAAKTFHVEKGRYLLLLKAFERRTLLALLPTLLVVEVITWGWALLQGLGAVGQKLRAYGWLAGHLAEVAAKRREVAAARAVPDSEFLRRCERGLSFEGLASSGIARAAETVFGPLLRASTAAAIRTTRTLGGRS